MKKVTRFLCFSLVAFSLKVVASTETPLSPQESCAYTLLENKDIYPILNPNLAKRQIAKIILKNGIQAYLISDPEAEQSAAGVSVEAGSWQDPEQYPGTAHFLEHMLFMGTKAYPDEGEYTKYVKDNGGLVNAFTASDRTVYMFSINNDAFIGGLDRFSHFFIDPLFNPSCISRELHAVDQEFSKNLENDFWRTYMVLKETSTAGHPNTKFSTGNAKTLANIPQEALQNWYNSHYSSDKMHLAAISTLPLEEMIKQVNEKFSRVVKQPVEASSCYGPLLSSRQKGHFLYIKPIKDMKMLSLIWELPREFACIEQKWTAELISYIFNDSSKHSLLQELKNGQLAESISAYTQNLSKEDHLFYVNISLTEQGLSQLDTVILLCNQLLAKLRQTGIPISIFQEVDTMAKINYQYQSRQDPFSWIADTACDLIDENLSTFPEKTFIPAAFDPEALGQFVSTLTPDSCVYAVLTDPDKLGITLSSKETWMHVPYSLEEIPSSKLLSWKLASPNPSIELPSMNPFLPTSLDLVGSSKKQEALISPVEILNTERTKIYFAEDHQYLVPESSYIFHLRTPAIDGSAKSEVFSNLLTKSLYDDLSSTFFFASHAGLSCKLSSKNLNFSIQISGYSEKAPKLTEEIFASLKQSNCSEERFNLYKDSLLSFYLNESEELPVKQAMSTAYNILLNDVPTPLEKKAALETITFEDFSKFCNNWLATVYLEGILYGNLTRNQATELSVSLEKQFASSNPYKNYKKKSLLLLPEDKGPFKVLQKTERQGNGTVLIIEQGVSSFRKRASQQILSVTLQEVFFDTLRTKQQTAYLVQSWASEVEKQLIQTFAVQSSSHLPEDLLYRFELFLEDFYKRLKELISEEQFELLKNSQMTALKIPPENMQDMTSYLSYLAFEQEGDFNRKEKQIQALEMLSYEEFIQDARSFISKSNPRRLAILVEGQQLPQKPLQYAEIAKEDIVKIGVSASL